VGLRNFGKALVQALLAGKQYGLIRLKPGVLLYESQ
jgi:hypothetical protein